MRAASAIAGASANRTLARLTLLMAQFNAPAPARSGGLRRGQFEIDLDLVSHRVRRSPLALPKTEIRAQKLRSPGDMGRVSDDPEREAERDRTGHAVKGELAGCDVGIAIRV